MKNNLNEFPARYIVDESGKKTDVIMSVDTFESLMAKFENLYLGILAEHVLATETEYVNWNDLQDKLSK